MDIILIRHGETEANIKKVFSTLDVKLSDRGKEQILKSKEYIQSLNFDKVYVSPLDRAVETMKLLDLNGQIEDSIKEISFGILEGKSYVEVNGEYPDKLKNGQKILFTMQFLKEKLLLMPIKG